MYETYLLVAVGKRLYAPSLEELAEIAECAIVAGDEIEALGARTASGWRALGRGEFGRFLGLLAARAKARSGWGPLTAGARDGREQ
jgi:hypothetical protein